MSLRRASKACTRLPRDFWVSSGLFKLQIPLEDIATSDHLACTPQVPRGAQKPRTGEHTARNPSLPSQFPGGQTSQVSFGPSRAPSSCAHPPPAPRGPRRLLAEVARPSAHTQTGRHHLHCSQGLGYSATAQAPVPSRSLSLPRCRQPDSKVVAPGVLQPL